MPDLQIGELTVPWDVTYSAKATRKRIEVTPSGVMVVAPAGTPLDGEDGLRAYVQAKRRWIFESLRQVRDKPRLIHEQHYASGAKVMYRGRHLLLDITSAETESTEIDCRSRFHIRVPAVVVAEDRQDQVRRALIAWMKERALDHATRWSRHYAKRLTVTPKGVRLGDQKTMWGSCGKDGVVRVHWQLIQAPASAMEYVVAHEVCHLVERNHTDRFWTTLATVMPDWSERRMLLERWERAYAVGDRDV